MGDGFGMSGLTDWMHDDISWCMDPNCDNTDCFRHPSHMRTKGPHSMAYFRGTDICPLMNKIIFLDIDGVLNDDHSKSRVPPEYWYHGIDKIHLRLLAFVADCTNAEIVLTSSWKLEWEPYRRSTQQPTPVGKYLANKLFDFGMKPIGKTKDDNDLFRGTGIRNWLYRHPWVKNYVILDDIVFPDYDEELQKHLVKTDPEVGLVMSDVSKAINILNGEV